MLDLQTCEQARLARDARFDGLFFIGVKSTGIYCRPICPARTCKPENVTYYPSAAAAASAGLRPCLRCRPEAAPGTPAWNGTSATVARALALIREGALNDNSVETLSARLGIGARHLRRLFQQHLGASPTEIAITQRVLFAKQLVTETDKSLTDVAFAAGFSTIRRFNAAFRKIYAQAPGGLRRRPPTSRAVTPFFQCRLKLAFRPPYNWPAMLAFFRQRTISGVELVDENSYRRTIRLGRTQGAIRLSLAPGGHALELAVRLNDSAGLLRVVERVRRMFDLNAHMEAIYAILAQDPLLARSIDRNRGLRLPGAWDPFEAAVRAVVGQQVSVAAARTVVGRIAALAGGRFVSDGDWPELRHYFPSADELAAADHTAYSMPEKRAATIKNLACAVSSGALALEINHGLPEFIAAMTALPGIGEWTAHYVAMRGLTEPDAFPASDLGILNALKTTDKRPAAKAVLTRAESWRPWRAYAAIYLWHLKEKTDDL
jgi:AraC family transcriptional regulator, regulatory protein of adaptative response / DNA-3-methyladenine glycosylase II